MAERQQDRDHGRITEEGLRGMKARIGIEIPHRDPWYSVAHVDSVRHFTWGCGDVNPLYSDEEYGKKTRWRSIIAHPLFTGSMGLSEKKELTPEEREKGRGGGMPGVHNFYSGDDIDWFQPIRPGDRLSIRDGLGSVEEKTSQFGGKSVISTNESVYRNQRGELVAVRRRILIWVERRETSGTRKYGERTIYHYTDEELAAIDADYEREEIRGAKPRYWEDVNVGDELTPVVKGPWTATYYIAMRCGAGPTGTGVGFLRQCYLPTSQEAPCNVSQDRV